MRTKCRGYPKDNQTIYFLMNMLFYLQRLLELFFYVRISVMIFFVTMLRLYLKIYYETEP